MNWELAFGIAMAVLVLIGIYVKHLRDLIKEANDFYYAVKDAIADREITREELKQIFKEAQDVGEVIINILALFQRR